MEMMTSLIATLDDANLSFTSGVKRQLANLSQFDLLSLDWLMMEHYQFSARNTGFLARAADGAKKFNNPAVEAELRRNLAEESGHARLYKRALSQVGVDVEQRAEFPPTAYFFHRISQLIDKDPSRMLGAMYATETAAIFEHEVFREISKEVIERRGINWESAQLAHFHDMHLSGVEQSHKDELGVYLECLAVEGPATGDGQVNTVLALDGGMRAISAMRRWWQDLLSQIHGIGVAA
jgi:Iron-containing redox enzyme